MSLSKRHTIIVLSSNGAHVYVSPLLRCTLWKCEEAIFKRTCNKQNRRQFSCDFPVVKKQVNKGASKMQAAQKNSVLVVVLPPSTYLFTAGVEGLLFHLITLRHTPQSVGLLWTRDRPVAETST
jgi:hypothetical protein